MGGKKGKETKGVRKGLNKKRGRKKREKKEGEKRGVGDKDRRVISGV